MNTPQTGSNDDDAESASLRSRLLAKPSLWLAGIVALGVAIAWGSAWWIRHWHELAPEQPKPLPYTAAAVELAITLALIALVVFVGLSEIARTGIHRPGRTEEEQDEEQKPFRFDAEGLPAKLNASLAVQLTAAIKARVEEAQAGGQPLSIESAVNAAVASSSDAPTLFEVLKYDLDLLNNRINSEYAGVSEKVGWLVTSQAFLVGAFVTLLNNSAIDPVERLLLMLGIGGIGLSGATALSIGIFFGHAWCEFLKTSRAGIEKMAYERFRIPRTGVPVSYGAHFLGHFATKLLASLSIAAWATLLILVGLNELQIAPTDISKASAQQTGQPTSASPPGGAPAATQ